jgi:hypothetical protein
VLQVEETGARPPPCQRWLPPAAARSVRPVVIELRSDFVSLA